MAIHERRYTLEQIGEYPSKRKECLRVGFIVVTWSSIFILTVTLVLFVILPELEVVTVKTKSGRIQATKVRRFDKVVNVFAGIPYAKPPVGDRRFRRPEPIEPWSRTLHSNPKRPSCYQHDTVSWNENLTTPHTEQSEDCLYLNIYVASLESPKPKPVMVWFHGGTFIFGSANWYDGSVLAAMQNIIVVTISSRLGIFGYLVSDSDEIPGNMGLMDQRMALKWIHRNIHAFGGDSKLVVLFGEYAGATSIGYHLLSPEINGLFKRAVLHSGGPLTPIMMFANRYRNNFRNVVNYTNCAEKGANHTWPATEAVLAKQIRCLKSLTPQSLVEAETQLARLNKSGFYPTKHGDFFAKHPYDAVENHEFGPQTELLIGTEEDIEMSQGNGFLDRLLIFKNASRNVTAQEIVNRMQKMNPDTTSDSYRVLADLIMKDDKVLDPAGLATRLTKIYNNFVIRCPSYFFVKNFVESGLEKRTRKVYFFQYGQSIGGVISGLMRKWSGSEAFFTGLTRYIFGYPLMDVASTDRQEVEFAVKTMQTWTNFIRTGNPTPDGSWIPCSSQELAYMSLNMRSSELVKGFPTNDCDDLAGWYSYGRATYSSSEKVPE